jgi:hypothetical protein
MLFSSLQNAIIIAIYMVNFFETFSIHYYNSMKQDPMVESQKNKIKSLYVICTRSGSLRVFFYKT